MFRESEERRIKNYRSRLGAILCCTPQIVTGFNKPGKFSIGYGVLGVACVVTAAFIKVLCSQEDCNSSAGDAQMPLIGIGVTSMVFCICSALKCLYKSCITDKIVSVNLKSITAERIDSERMVDASI